MKILMYIIERLKERSTWAGILTLATTAGVALEPELKEAIIAAGVSLVGVAMVLLKEKDTK